MTLILTHTCNTINVTTPLERHIRHRDPYYRNNKTLFEQCLIFYKAITLLTLLFLFNRAQSTEMGELDSD